MKKLGIILVLVIMAITTFGESPLNLGIKFGINSSKLNTNFDAVLDQNYDELDINHYLGGIFARAAIGRLYVQPEAYFNTKGGEFADPNSSVYTSANQINYQTIDLPVLIGIKFVNRSWVNVRGYVGPLFTFITAATVGSGIKNLTYDDFNNNYMGWQAGVGVDLWFLTIDARMENSPNIFTPYSEYTALNRVFLLSAGIKLF